MPIIKTFIFSLLISSWAMAETHMLFWPYFPALRLDRGEDQNLKSRSAFASGVGLIVDDWYGTLESEKFEASSSEGNTSIKRTYQDLSLWGGYSLFSGEKWRVMGVAGLGFYKERVESKIGTIEDSNTSGEKSLYGAGLEWVLLEPSTYFTFSTAVKMLWSPDFDPNPQPELVLKIGLKL